MAGSHRGSPHNPCSGLKFGIAPNEDRHSLFYFSAPERGTGKLTLGMNSFRNSGEAVSKRREVMCGQVENMLLILLDK
jgi:hypothetical protein